MNPPKWAQELLLDACLEFGQNDVPVLTWRKHKASPSTGCARLKDKTIVVSAGTSRRDQKVVLLHELAHIIYGAKARYLNIDRAKKRGTIFVGETEDIISSFAYHTAEFWDLAWALFRWAKLPLRYCLRREGNYRAGALIAYRRNRTKKCQAQSIVSSGRGTSGNCGEN